MKKIQETTYFENTAAFYCRRDDNPLLEDGKWFCAKHNDISGRNPDIGTDLYDLALIPSSASFHPYSISLAMDEKTVVGRYPDNSNEVRISDYSYDIYSKKLPNLDFNGVLEQVSSLIRRKRSWLMPLSDVGVYKGRE